MVVLTSFTQPTDGIRHRQNNTTVYVNDNNIGKGTLFIAESRLSWVSDSGNGFSLEYPHISLHAVSRDLTAFPQECLFLMLDTAIGDEETSNGNGENDNGDENDSEGETTEIRLVPDDRGMLDAMFHAMNACQALHPDPEDSFSDEDFYEDADDEIPMEETDYRMAGLRIESTDGRPHIGRGAVVEEDMEEAEEDRVGGTLGTLGVRAVGGNIWGAGDSTSGVAGMAVGDSTWGVAGMAVGDSTWGVAGMAVGDSTWGAAVRAVGEREGAVREEGGSTWVGEGRGVGTWDTLGRAGGDRAVDTLGRAGGDRAVGTWGTLGDSGASDRVVGTLGTLGGRVSVAAGPGPMPGPGAAPPLESGRGGRPYSSGSTWHQGRPALCPPAQSLQTGPKNHHNFDDAEN